MDQSEKNVRTLLEKVTLQCDANWIAFSGGLDSSILGQIKKDQDLNAITIITKDFLGTDLEYSQIVGKHIDVPLELKYVNINEIFDAIKNTIKILKNFNDIEIKTRSISASLIPNPVNLRAKPSEIFVRFCSISFVSLCHSLSSICLLYTSDAADE